MRTWARTRLECRCGLCGHTIAEGSPVLVLEVLGVHRPKLRCQTCAGGPVPSELPMRSPRETGVTPLRQIAHAVAFDYKAAQLGEREPGEDG